MDPAHKDTPGSWSVSTSIIAQPGSRQNLFIMNYIDCLIMNEGLADVNAPGMKSRFSYAVARNKRILEPVVKSLQEIVEPNADHKKFQEERQAILKKHAEKDENGDPIMQTTNVGGRPQQNYRILGISNEKNPFNLEIDSS